MRILTFLLLVITGCLFIVSCKSNKDVLTLHGAYNVKLNTANGDLDTVLSVKDIRNRLDSFMEFNYPPLKTTSEKGRLLLYNDEIRIIITTAPFDSINNSMTLSKEGNYYTKINHRNYYGCDGMMPEEQISGFSIQVKGKKLDLDKKYYRDLFDPSILCNENYCPTTGHITESGDVIVLMNNSEGAGFYYAIFIFDKTGKFKNRIVRSVL